MGKTRKHKEFFQGDSPHGLVKRVMYKKYLQAYIPMTQSDRFTLRTVIIDGFAGAGRYSNEWPNELEKYGSPLIAMMVVLEHVVKKKEESPEQNIDPVPVFGWESSLLTPMEELKSMDKDQRETCVNTQLAKVKLIFIEQDKENYTTLLCHIELLILKFLQRHFPQIKYNVMEREGVTMFSITTQPFSVSIEVQNCSFGDYQPSRSELLDKSVRSLTFVDPFGYTHTPMDHVKKFAPGEGNEIMINFMSRDVNRFAKKQPEKISQLYGLPKFDEVADDYCIGRPNTGELGEFINYVRNNICPGAQEHRSSIQKCVDTYELFLKKKTGSSYSLVFEVRGEGNCIIYHIVYITNHIRGVEVMKSAMTKCSTHEEKMLMSDYDVIRKGNKLTFQKTQNDQAVAEKIFERFKGMKDVVVQYHGNHKYEESPSVKTFVLLETVYCKWKTPLAILQKAGKIIDVLENGKPQKSKNKFPHEDSVTKKPIVTRITFALEACETDNPTKDEHTVIDNKDEKGQKRRKQGQNDQAVADKIFERFKGMKDVVVQHHGNNKNEESPSDRFPEKDSVTNELINTRIMFALEACEINNPTKDKRPDTDNKDEKGRKRRKRGQNTSEKANTKTESESKRRKKESFYVDGEINVLRMSEI
ncbi:hypothetical protein DPMN_127614 [Dreissena polymorpha]|uniref:Uncharacterized protein n=1 Tax=Dreissena polymorpha TaxID=45954 RepID=A0A9D4H1K0_DREPO|nr:hypothetical protein DPMN_127614 [Dreissena polymorpha]